MLAHMVALFATLATIIDLNWYPDSSATNHLTPNVANLGHRVNYIGPNQICVGNGTGLAIQHVGHSIFHTPLSS